MPSKSNKQARFMAAAAHNPSFAKKAGISMSVAKEFNSADTATKLPARSSAAKGTGKIKPKKKKKK
jgi:hypothetical protein